MWRSTNYGRISFLAEVNDSTFNQHVTNGLSHVDQIDESTFILRGSGSDFSLFLFFDENHVIKQNSPRWDAAFRGVTSALFCLPRPHVKDAGLIWVNDNK